MNTQDEKKKKMILFGGTAIFMLALLIVWILNLDIFLSQADRAALAQPDKNLSFAEIKKEFTASFEPLTKSLDALSEKSRLASETEASEEKLKLFAASMEDKINDNEIAGMATTSSSTDFSVEVVASSSVSTSSTSTAAADETAQEIKNKIDEINKRIQSNKE